MVGMVVLAVVVDQIVLALEVLEIHLVRVRAKVTTAVMFQLIFTAVVAAGQVKPELTHRLGKAAMAVTELPH
jgi:hypothetical protein